MSIRKEILSAPSVAILKSVYNKGVQHPGVRGKNLRRWERAYNSRLAFLEANPPAPVATVKPARITRTTAKKPLSMSPDAVAKRAKRAAAKEKALA